MFLFEVFQLISEEDEKVWVTKSCFTLHTQLQIIRLNSQIPHSLSTVILHPKISTNVADGFGGPNRTKSDLHHMIQDNLGSFYMENRSGPRTEPTAGLSVVEVGEDDRHPWLKWCRRIFDRPCQRQHLLQRTEIEQQLAVGDFCTVKCFKNQTGKKV